jgi:hypothetical protein
LSLIRGVLPIASAIPLRICMMLRSGLLDRAALKVTRTLSGKPDRYKLEKNGADIRCGVAHIAYGLTISEDVSF